MHSFQKYKKFIPYSDRVFSSIEWSHWFLLFNVFISIIISVRYILNTNYSFTQFATVYQIVNLLGHLWFVNFVFFLFIPFPLAFILTNDRFYRIFCICAAVLGQTVLLIDTQIFHYFKFHINPTLLQVFRDNSDYHTGINFNFLYVVIPILVVAEIVLAKYATHKTNKHRNNWITTACLSIFISSFALSHLIHIWADYTDYQPIIVQDSTLPLSYPMTAKTFIAKNDWIVLPSVEGSNTTSSDMKYPLTSIKVSTSEVKKFNYLVISVKGLGYSMLTQKYMPFTTQFSKKAQLFTNHYAANTLSDEAMFPFFYGISPQYYHSALVNSVSPILIEELQHEEYHVRTFISNESQDKTILDTNTFSTIRERIPETLKSDKETVSAVVSFLEKINEQKSGSAIPQFMYVSLANPSILKNESSKVRFTPTITNDEGKLLSKKLDTRNVETLRNAYANSIYSTDRAIEKIITALEGTSFKDNTIVIITGEYGFDMGYRNLKQFGYSGDYTFEKLHVPFMIHDPSMLPKTYEFISGHEDVAPTLLETYLGVTTPNNEYSTGRNLFNPASNSEFVISGDSRQIYIVENSQITRINRRGGLFLTDSTDNQKAVNIKMPTLLKAMRQLNKFYNE